MGEERGCGVVYGNIEAGVWRMGRVGSGSLRVKDNGSRSGNRGKAPLNSSRYSHFE